MVIDCILVCHVVDPYLRTDMFFGKEQAAENGGIDFEIRDIGTSAHWYWRLKDFMQSLSAFLLPFW